MSLFDNRKSGPPDRTGTLDSPIPITQMDVGKRYDVYCSVSGEERLYEDVRFVGIRTFERLNEFSTGLVNGYLEIEARDGSRLLIPSYGVQLLCEHGTRPTYKVLRRWGNTVDY